MLNRCTEMYIPWKSRSRKACVNFESACIIPWKLGTYSTSLTRDSEASDYLSTCKLDGVWIFKLDYHSMINHQWTWFTQLTDTQNKLCFMSRVLQTFTDFLIVSSLPLTTLSYISSFLFFSTRRRSSSGASPLMLRPVIITISCILFVSSGYRNAKKTLLIHINNYGSFGTPVQACFILQSIVQWKFVKQTVMTDVILELNPISVMLLSTSCSSWTWVELLKYLIQFSQCYAHTHNY